jgi:phage host-nuclease inhibitor protein Gam
MTTHDIITTSPEQRAKRAKELIETKIKRFGELDNLITNATKDQQANVQSIVNATKEVLKPLADEKATLKAEIETLATENRKDLFGSKKTLDLGTHALAFRASTAVECDNEEEMIDLLETAATNPEHSESHRLAAQACLRYETPSLDKSFVKKHWKKHTAWFGDYFGFRLTPKESFSITTKATPEIPED